jgi:hypothetical protein
MAVHKALLTGAQSDVASERLRVLHIRPNLQGNQALLEAPNPQNSGVGNAGNTHVVQF